MTIFVIELCNNFLIPEVNFIKGCSKINTLCSNKRSKIVLMNKKKIDVVSLQRGQFKVCLQVIDVPHVFESTYSIWKTSTL